MNRRWVVATAVGGVAAAAGMGWALWREHQAASSTGGLWSMRFPTPSGGELAMESFRGRPLLLNFWATWCAPCLKEMPDLDRFHRAMAPRGWTVVGLAIDGPTPVREFLERVRVGFPIGLAGFGGTELAKRLGNSSGALPFTVLFSAEGGAVRRKLGATTFDELTSWAKENA